MDIHRPGTKKAKQVSDIKLFRIAAGAVTELAGTTDTVEKSV